MFGYRVPAPDEAMLISGGRYGRNGAPFRVVTGHGAFIFPIFRKTRFLTLAMCEAEVAETCVTKQGISLNVRSVIAFKVGNDEESIVNAGQRFLSDQDQMSTLTGRIFAGHLRSIIGSMTVEEIVTERQKLASEVLDGSKAEMVKIGLTVDSLQIQSIDDMNIRLHRRDGRPAQRRDPAAGADRAGAGQPGLGRGAAAVAARAGRVRPADLRRPGAVQGGGGQGAGRGGAGRPAGAGPGHDGGARRPDRAGAPAGRAAPAPAGRRGDQACRGRGGEGAHPGRRPTPQRVTIQAEAAASHHRIALDRMLIDQLPQIVREAAGGLAGANVSVLNGADGLSEIAAGLVGQGLTILDSVKKSLAKLVGQGHQLRTTWSGSAD